VVKEEIENYKEHYMSVDEEKGENHEGKRDKRVTESKVREREALQCAQT
jgi:hypothetical protein